MEKAIEGMTMDQEGNTQVQVQATKDACPNEQWYKGKKKRGRWFEDWPKKEQSRNSMTAGRLYLGISWPFSGGIRAQRRGLGVSMLSMMTRVPDGGAPCLDSALLVEEGLD
jgi:hypothetical protein